MVMNGVYDHSGIKLLKDELDINFYKIAKDSCFLTPSLSTLKQHVSSNHVYTVQRMGELRVGWINQDGYALALAGNYKEALTRFDEALRIEPNYMHAWNHKGLCNYFLERYPASLNCFTAAIKLNQQFIEPYINKGCSLQRLNKFERAINCFEDAESINPNSFENWANKSISLIALGDFTGALNCLDRAVVFNCVAPSIYGLRSICFFILERFNEGFEDLKSAVELDSSNRTIIDLLKVYDTMV
ncbi:MAG TPA: tetratricopeptide repeat protein [Candidatus Acidoferrales bacterium]|nr:tetratricopeptide repeat protein [Candidatus Acidoferrales bacterium]